MNRLHLFASLTLCSLVLTACSKDLDDPNGIPENAIMLSTEGYIDSSGEKTSVSGYTVEWVGDGEVVRLNEYTPSVEVSGDQAFVQGVTLSGTVYGYYPSTIVADDGWETTTPIVNIPSSYSCTMSGNRQIIALPMAAYTSSTTDEISFKHLTAAVNIIVWNATSEDLCVDRVVVTAAGHRLHGDISINFEDVNYGIAASYDDPVNESDSSVSITFPSSGEGSLIIQPGENNTKSIQVPILPVHNDRDITIQIYTHVNGASWHKYIFNHHASLPNALTRNKMLTARCKIHTGEGNHVTENVFSISSTEKVFFSLGNLQYQATTSTWRFAEHQYDYIGNDNSNISENYAGWIDLFGWGTSSHKFASGYGSAFQPWSTSTTDTAYGPKGTTNLSGDYANGDWGIENSIGSDVAGTWYTLTKDEWVYLLNTRSGSTINGTNNARFTEARINTDGTEVKGLIIFPDNYTAGTPNGVSWGTINSASAWGTTCTVAGWTALEAAGCVFLPVAGYRNGTSVSGTSTTGGYWSSTAPTENNAYRLRIYSGIVEPVYEVLRYRGSSVRLVRNAN